MFVLAPMATKTTSLVSGNGRQAISREDIRIFFSASHRKSYCLPLSFNIRGMSFSSSSSLNPSTSHSFPFLNSPLVLLFFYSSIFFLFPFFVLSSPMKNIPHGTLKPIFFFSFWSFLFLFFSFLTFCIHLTIVYCGSSSKLPSHIYLGARYASWLQKTLLNICRYRTKKTDSGCLKKLDLGWENNLVSKLIDSVSSCILSTQLKPGLIISAFTYHSECSRD